MAMIDHAIRAANRSDCLLALFPYQNGALFNALPSAGAFDRSWQNTNCWLTPDNIQVAPQGFSALDPTQLAGIKTHLDLRNNQTGKTFIVKAFCPSHSDSDLHIHALITQGSHSGGASLQTFQFVIWERPGDFKLRGYIVNSNAAFAGTAGNLSAADFDSFHIFAMTVDMESRPGKMLIKLYKDGQLQASTTQVYSPWNSPVDGSLTGNLAVRQDSDQKYVAGNTVQWAMVFDSVLTQSELQLFR
ncbi:MAG: hypothetical protein E7047_01785 [Lentisphaerae bacterium]|nr:hypothetical protein [Lentisphaerota bacterium]